jgi:ATP-dependent DNA ligase
MGLEGIVSKLRDSVYRSERSEAWIKTKCNQISRYEVIGYKNGATSIYLGKRQETTLFMLEKQVPASPTR